ncbi:hypothetical protein [Geminisphaera colitermitum]|uniref:hypothetical protein n=1 Tax=Geminisphaera colitermitum TaxID=1148786 RepID=UPI00030398FD|nr:hypothetical protein [Geminisphaera colitermitum]
MASITDTADLSATVGEAVNDRIPSALAESASELPGRINTAIDTVGKGFWNSIPGWLKFLGFAALGIWVLTLLKPYIDGALKAKGVLKK